MFWERRRWGGVCLCVRQEVWLCDWRGECVDRRRNLMIWEFFRKSEWSHSDSGDLVMWMKTFCICWCCKRGQFVMVGWSTVALTDAQTGNYQGPTSKLFHANTHMFHARALMHAHAFTHMKYIIKHWSLSATAAWQPTPKYISSFWLSKAIKEGRVGWGGGYEKADGTNSETVTWRGPQVSTFLRVHFVPCPAPAMRSSEESEDEKIEMM